MQDHFVDFLFVVSAVLNLLSRELVKIKTKMFQYQNIYVNVKGIWSFILPKAFISILSKNQNW